MLQKLMIAAAISGALLAGDATAQTFDFKAADDMVARADAAYAKASAANAEVQKHFDSKYLGKRFSAVGAVDRYAKSIFFSPAWFVEVTPKGGRSSVYCIVGSDENDGVLKDLQRRFPEGSTVRIRGKFAEWNTYDKTLRLHHALEARQDSCTIEK